MDLTIFSLLSVAGYWIYGPLWGSFSCYAHKCTWTMLLAYLPLISCHWTKDLGGTQGTDWYSRLPHHCFHVPGPSCEFSCWHFGGCLTSGSCPWGILLHASSDALSTGKATKHLRAGCQEQKVPRQENLKNKLLWKQPCWGATPHPLVTVFMTEGAAGTVRWGNQKYVSERSFIAVPCWFISQWQGATSTSGEL